MSAGCATPATASCARGKPSFDHPRCLRPRRQPIDIGPSVLARIDCGPSAFVNPSLSPALHVLTDAATGPELSLDDPDGS